MSTSDITVVEDIHATAPVSGARDGAMASSRVRFERFLKAIQSLPPAPCVGCPMAERCGTKRLACELFYQYAHVEDRKPWPYSTPPTREPNRAIYNALFSGDVDDRRQELRPREKVQRARRVTGIPDNVVRLVRKAEGNNQAIADQHGLSKAQVQRIRSGTAYQDVA